MFNFIKFLFFFGSMLGVALSIGAFVLYQNVISENLPPVEALKDVRLQVPLRVYSSDGQLMAEFGEKRRQPVPIEEVPNWVKNAYIAIEDKRFYQHKGVDYVGLTRAVINLLSTWEKGQGASTITMQVARNFFLSREKTYLRKINEIFLAYKIESLLSKDEILELYLNKIYLGNRAYGVAAAAQVYYGVSLDELTLAQAAMLGGLPKAPSRMNPVKNPSRALQRRNYILKQMLDLDMIDQTMFDEAIAAKITAKIHAVSSDVDAPYASEMARLEVESMFDERTYSDGLKVYTTINAEQQHAANKAVIKALLAYQERQGYAGALETLASEALDDKIKRDEVFDRYPAYGGLQVAVVAAVEEDKALLHIKVDSHSEELQPDTLQLGLEGVQWISKTPPKSIGEVLKPGEVVYISQLDGQVKLAQMPDVEAALVAIDPHNGATLSLVGGFDFDRSKFNRVTQANRQSGSIFKPFLYSAALEKGYTAASVINDSPVVFDDPALESAWRPENYSGKFYGPTRFREALVKSRNLVSIRLMIDLGVPYVIDYVKKFGFENSYLPRDLSLALGSGILTPMQVARAYAVFANGGYLVESYLVDRVESDDGVLLFKANPAVVCETCDEQQQIESESEDSLENHAPRVLEERNAAVMRSILQDVVRRGTATRARRLGRADIAGKTGTTNDQHDAWFAGFNQQVVAAAWVGYDDQLSLGRGETGGRAALPIWMDYMRAALKGVPQDSVVELPNMASVLIDPKTGKLATVGNREAIIEIFREENVPLPTIGGDFGDEQTEQQLQQSEETATGLF